MVKHMGEIRIKSGNLYTIELGDDRWRTLGNGQIISRTDGVLQIEMTSEKNSGVYAVSTSAIGQLSDIRSTVSYSFDIRADTDISVLVGYEVQGARVLLQVSDEWVTVKVENILFTQSYSFTIVNRSSGGTVYLRNFMLNEGSTALPYQPYFLNRPAHKFTNGEWIDIPTHHYTNGRWQGELTSQSPLKFWADGEMLDWRVEGKTSENLVESFKNTENTEQYKNCLFGMLNIKPSTSYTISFIMEEGVKAYFNENLFAFKNFTGTGQRQVVNVTTKDDINKTDSTWYAKYGWILCKNMFNNEKPCNFREVMILEGTYTSETIPPYEPYGNGVGDWDETEQKYRIPVTVNGVTTTLYTDHQLMDGDSIDYTTDQTAIPLATGNNVLTVDTAVQPSKVFVKFEG